MFGDGETHVDFTEAPFLARLTGVYTVPSGAQTGQNQYFFIEQSIAPSSGFPVDADPPRQTSPTSGTPVDSYALEANNTLLTVPGTTPTGYTNPGPYVEMRLKGIIGGVPVYEFDVFSPSSGGSIELLDKSGSVIDAACTILQMDSRGILTATGGAGSDQFSVADASATQQGVVNITTQSFAGTKTFLAAQTWADGIVNCTETIAWTGSGSNGHGGVSTLAYPNMITGPTGFTWQNDNLGTYITDFSFSSTAFVGTNYSLLTLSGNGSSPGLFVIVNDDLVQGAGSTSTSATHGFMYISTCNGAPTGTPLSPALGGYAPIIYDKTNHKLWAYDFGTSTWKGVVLT